MSESWYFCRRSRRCHVSFYLDYFLGNMCYFYELRGGFSSRGVAMVTVVLCSFIDRIEKVWSRGRRWRCRVLTDFRNAYQITAGICMHIRWSSGPWWLIGRSRPWGINMPGLGILHARQPLVLFKNINIWMSSGREVPGWSLRGLSLCHRR